jgi:hypothetical protein
LYVSSGLFVVLPQLVLFDVSLLFLSAANTIFAAAATAKINNVLYKGAFMKWARPI